MELRIISGRLKGKKLRSVRGVTIRPTADRLRESIFNILSNQVLNAMVLDLFAGTGALGMEALSRGAESAVFVDNNPGALSVIQRNITSCAFDKQAHIIKWDIKKNLDCLKSAGTAFDLVFMDPPYNQGMVKSALFNLEQTGSLEQAARIVVEHSPLEPIPEDIFMFEIADRRKYGKTLVSFLTYMV
ncbi:MAG: 16S rRNA (guanine(966)-N(2))-methyltransferase RsmD [Desulfobacterales bacterium]|jgi:16S rRNA (guanine966-N2)-methyltransferase